MGTQTNGTNGKSWAQTYPELGTGPVPIEPCISPEYHALERERIFKQVWLNVGRVEEIPKAGDYLVKNIAAGEASVLVVRGNSWPMTPRHARKSGGMICLTATPPRMPSPGTRNGKSCGSAP